MTKTRFHCAWSLVLKVVKPKAVLSMMTDKVAGGPENGQKQLLR